MKKLLSIFAMVMGIAVAAHAQEMSLKVTPYSGNDTVAKVQGIDNAHFISYFAREKVDEKNDKRLDSLHYFVVVRTEPFDINKLQLYYGTIDKSLAKVTLVPFANAKDKNNKGIMKDPDDYTKTLFNTQLLGLITFVSGRDTYHWGRTANQDIELQKSHIKSLSKPSVCGGFLHCPINMIR